MVGPTIDFDTSPFNPNNNVNNTYFFVFCLQNRPLLYMNFQKGFDVIPWMCCNLLGLQAKILHGLINAHTLGIHLGLELFTGQLP